MNAHAAKPALNPAFKVFQSLPSLFMLLKRRGNAVNECSKPVGDKPLSPEAGCQNVVNSNRYARTLH
jgi:hypothetical protein